MKKAESKVRSTKASLEQLLEEARRITKVKVKRKHDLPEELKAAFQTMPETLGELEDAINSAHARIQLMARADEQV